MRITRDSVWLGVVTVGSILAYLGTMPPPQDWSYQQWMASTAALIAILSAKLQTSPLRGSDDA